MKLISCYIENFGGLHQYALDFSEGLTVIQEPNGFGKTTLAEFIRAMFYGFPKKSPKQMGKRQRYTPWSGGKCSGHLTFEHEGACYRIERTFGAVPRSDTCKIFDLKTGQETTRFSKEVGLELFGLDAESFERSTYLPQSREIGTLTTDSIRAKLGDLVEDANDVGNYEKAVNALKTARSRLVAYRGSGGTVAEATGRITRIQQNLDSAQESEGNLAAAAERAAALEEAQGRIAAEIGSVRAAMEAANRAESIRTHHQHHDQKAAELAEVRSRLREVMGRYPQGLPNDEDLNTVSEAVDRANRLDGYQVTTEEDQRAQRFVEENRDRFTAGVPAADELDAMHQKLNHCSALEAKLAVCILPEAEAAELEETEAFFAHGVPDEQTLRRQEAALAEAERLRSDNQRLASQTAAEPQYKVPSPLTVPLLLGCGVMGALAGVVLLARSNFASGGVALALGVLALLGAAYLSLRTAMARQTVGISPQVQTMIRQNEETIAQLEKTVRSFAEAYHNAVPGEIRRRVQRLHALRRREADLASDRQRLMKEWDETDGAIHSFLERFREGEGDPFDGLNRLRRACEAWNRAQRQLADRTQREQQFLQEQAQVRTMLEAFGSKYAILPRSRSQVLAIRDDIRTVREQTAKARTLEQQLAAYCRDHADALAAPVPGEREDPAALRRREAVMLTRQKEIMDELLRTRQRMERLREDADRIPELRDELAAWQEKKQADQASAAVLDDAVAFLGQAKDDLATAYMGPIRDSFAALMARMTGEASAGILVTPELEVRLEREGSSRELGYFSAGQTDLVMLCMRLALVDALFRDAKPFVILDDPFVNLDDRRTREALELLKDLSRDRQIIYLVCNSSRV